MDKPYEGYVEANDPSIYCEHGPDRFDPQPPLRTKSIPPQQLKRLRQQCAGLPVPIPIRDYGDNRDSRNSFPEPSE